MGSTYEMAKVASYENHPHHSQVFQSAPVLLDRERQVLNERPAPNEQLYNSRPQYATQYHIPQNPLALPAPRPSHQYTQQPPSQTTGQPSSHQPPPSLSQPSLTLPQPSSATLDHDQKDKRDRVMVSHSLVTPESIDPNRGNLADFVAELAAFFWFESTAVMESAENIRFTPRGAPVRRISPLAKATPEFKKWVENILSTTQVTQNVIFLALLFLYRLKTKNPMVRGRPGSEYRLFTVALMLGNKFLDDNTYTNKTWAEVSGISVNEIHIMEVEFLSNMRYSLLVSKEEWEEWLDRCSKLREFLQRSQRYSSPSPILIPSPTHRSYVSPLPSPTGPLQLMHQQRAAYDEGGYGQNWPQAAGAAASPLALKPEPRGLERKRSFPDIDPTEPPAKRVNRGAPSHQTVPLSSQPPLYPLQQVVQQHQVSSQRPSMVTRAAAATAPDHLRLSVPNLSINTIQNASVAPQSYPAVSYAPPQASPLSLPPLVPGVRAMSTVFPASSTNYSPIPSLSSTTSTLASLPAAMTPTSALPPVTYGTPTKRLSPQNALTPSVPYPGSSPLADSFHNGGASGAHTPISHSPSVYLQYRNSPYKPVQHVKTLLYPPPSAFLQQYHIANTIPPTQMHYQPLGRRNDVRTGIVPEFAFARAGHQGYGNTSQILPDPNQGGRYPPSAGLPMPVPSYN
ncbi:hypothetical protein QBC47DRAFT_307633 [Echria macrotheca]|uniref:Cyclin n=1 Tax=Echria macrotheca TaxID=438768 RepID=A0AAJ0B4P2_9PEZI|nr:hypothetical protein QBC47DRAFT_307633 [Echria macrotheca]